MAQLNDENAQRMADAKDGFEPLDPGAYHAVLKDVDPTRSGPKGPYWSWEYEVVEEGDWKGRKLWNNTSLAEGSEFGFKQTFEAFGAETTADTDDLLGQCVKLIVSVRTIEQGTRKGELGNNIDRVVAKDPDFEPPEPVAASPSPDDVFGED